MFSEGAAWEPGGTTPTIVRRRSRRRSRSGGGVGAAFNQATLDLTPYEVGNAVWKNHHRRSEIGPDRLRRLLDLLDHVAVEPVDSLDLVHVMTIAVEESITCYDAAHVASADSEWHTPVTEDAKLADVAGRYVDVTSVGAH